MKKLFVPYHRQNNSYTCGPAVLQMIFGYFRYFKSQEELASETAAEPKNGTPNRIMVRVAVDHGFNTYVNTGSTLHEIRHFVEVGLPVIVNYIEPSTNEGHFAVVSGFDEDFLFLNDPWNGKDFKIGEDEFLGRWRDEGNKYRRWIMVVSREVRDFGRLLRS